MGILELKEPYRVTISAKWLGYTNGMLMGLAVIGENLFGVIIGEDGIVHTLTTDQFAIDWRYDVERDQWFDVSTGNSPDVTALG